LKQKRNDKYSINYVGSTGNQPNGIVLTTWSPLMDVSWRWIDPMLSILYLQWKVDWLIIEVFFFKFFCTSCWVCTSTVEQWQTPKKA
jgi:hypothetical protein